MRNWYRRALVDKYASNQDIRNLLDQTQNNVSMRLLFFIYGSRMGLTVTRTFLGKVDFLTSLFSRLKMSEGTAIDSRIQAVSCSTNKLLGLFLKFNQYLNFPPIDGSFQISYSFLNYFQFGCCGASGCGDYNSPPTSCHWEGGIRPVMTPWRIFDFCLRVKN